MADQLTLCLANAERALAEAKTATLDNVRDRHLRAAQAWTEMAQRIERVERARAERTGGASSAPD